jgi:hypothetical protein
MQSLRCPHCRRCPGSLAAHPFTGVNAHLLVLGLFGVFPAQSAPIRACAPSLSNSSKSISLIALALAPAQTTVWPTFAVNGACPLASVFLADLWACSTPSGAGSALSSETLPALFFCQLSRFRAALFSFQGITTAPRVHVHELHIAKAMCTSARAVDTSRHATATATKTCAQAHNNIVASHGGDGDQALCASTGQHVMLHGGNSNQALCASARQNVPLHGGNGSQALCASARQHIALHGGNGDKLSEIAGCAACTSME